MDSSKDDKPASSTRRSLASRLSVTTRKSTNSNSNDQEEQQPQNNKRSSRLSLTSFSRKRNSTSTASTANTNPPDPFTKFHRHPSWSLSTTFAIGLLRTGSQFGKDNLDKIRAFTSTISGSSPTPPFRVKITQIQIQRRESCIVDGMSMEDATGIIDAEWVDYAPNSTTSTSKPKRVILYLHGGAYFLGSRKSHRSITWRLSKHCNAKILAIDYRLAPEHTFPLALHDALSSYLYLLDPPSSASSNTTKYKNAEVFVMGDSAGGGLAMAMTLWLRDHVDEGYCMPKGLGLLAPWIDLTNSMPSYRTNGVYDFLPEVFCGDVRYINNERKQLYLPDNTNLTNPLVSPLFGTESSSTPLPPILLHIGDAERLRDENIKFYLSTLPNSSIHLEIFEGMIHVFHGFAGLGFFNGIAERGFVGLGRFVESQMMDDEVMNTTARSVKFIFNRRGCPEMVVRDEELDAVLKASRGGLERVLGAFAEKGDVGTVRTDQVVRGLRGGVLNVGTLEAKL
ncbi:hypothetical protein HDU76_001182 [Blyttiomyces sp. JEL0837]|nr:hypothetical protein HDU76_001182 [Blyttiomyces sp. JEL0837]